MKFKQNQILVTILFLSIVVVILNDILLNETPEIISFGDELGAILSNLSLAYISSFIFYYVVVVIKERSDKRNIYSTVHQLTNYLVGRAYSVCDVLISATGTGNKYDRKSINKAQFTELCNMVDPNEVSKTNKLGTVNNLKEATYGQLIYNNAVLNVNDYSQKIFNYMPFLDSKHVQLINKLQGSNFLLMAHLLNIPMGNKDFSAYADPMFEFLEFVRGLDLYNEEVNSKLIRD